MVIAPLHCPRRKQEGLGDVCFRPNVKDGYDSQSGVNSQSGETGEEVQLQHEQGRCGEMFKGEKRKENPLVTIR